MECETEGSMHAEVLRQARATVREGRGPSWSSEKLEISDVSTVSGRMLLRPDSKNLREPLKDF